ncbi:GspE/PulE family protein, partial [Escherichia coli]
NTPGRNILTVEDPVEYELEGIGQTQVNTRVDMSFARGLRAILRQDPDVVMVGEIRDTETAQIAVQASLTGHLVLSTLHTNSASGAVTRPATWASNHSCFRLPWQGLSRNVWFVACVRNADNSRPYHPNKRRCLNIISSR